MHELLGQRTRSQTTLMLEDITLIRNLGMGLRLIHSSVKTISLQQIKENTIYTVMSILALRLKKQS